MAMEPNLDGIAAEDLRGDASGRDLAHDELVEEQAVGREVAGCLPHFRRHEVRILVPEAQDAGGLDADQRRVGRHQVRQEADIADGKAPRQLQAALGDGCAAAFDVLRYDDVVPQPSQKPRKCQAQLRLLIVSEFVCKQVNPPCKALSIHPTVYLLNKTRRFVQKHPFFGPFLNKTVLFVQ